MIIIKLFRFIKEEFPKLADSLKIDKVAENFHLFINKLIKKFCQIWSIKLNYNTEEIYNEICDNFESMITKKLYNQIFCSSRKDREEDYKFDYLLEKYQFITPDLFEIPSSVLDNNYLSMAINKLSIINQCKSPKEKLYTFMNVVNILSIMYSKNSNKETSPGADEIFPLIIFTVIKGKVPKLKSNQNYCDLFRHISRKQGIEDYYLETFRAVINFISSLEEHDLNVSKEQFKKLSENSEKNLFLKLKDYENPYFKNQNQEMIISFLVDKNIKNFINVPIAKKNILNIDNDKIYKKYFNEDIEKFDKEKLNDMNIDFKEVLYLINSYKKNDYNERETKEDEENKQNILDFFENNKKIEKENNINGLNDNIISPFGGKIAKLIDI